MFDRVKRKRANRQQIVSSIPTEEVKYLADKLKEYGNHRMYQRPNMRESLLRERGYIHMRKSRRADLSSDKTSFKRCDEVLRSADNNQEGLTG
jgi:hypothetical protein